MIEVSVYLLLCLLFSYGLSLIEYGMLVDASKRSTRLRVNKHRKLFLIPFIGVPLAVLFFLWMLWTLLYACFMWIWVGSDEFRNP